MVESDMASCFIQFRVYPTLSPSIGRLVGRLSSHAIFASLPLFCLPPEFENRVLCAAAPPAPRLRFPRRQRGREGDAPTAAAAATARPSALARQRRPDQPTTQVRTDRPRFGGSHPNRLPHERPVGRQTGQPARQTHSSGTQLAPNETTMTRVRSVDVPKNEPTILILRDVSNIASHSNLPHL